MKNGSIQDRLLRLEKKRRFLDWVLQYRFLINRTPEELQTVNSGKEFCAPLGNRAPSSVLSGRIRRLVPAQLLRRAGSPSRYYKTVSQNHSHADERDATHHWQR